MLLTREEFFARLEEEAESAYRKHGNEPWSRHEFYGILLEEVEELWDGIKHNLDEDYVMDELVQVAYVCLRYAETGNKHTQKEL